MVHFFLGLTFRYVLVNSHLIHPPSNSWLLTLGILQTYPLSESFMIDFLMPYIHRLIDQPPLNHNRQKLISCHCTSGSFQEKKSGPFLVWYFIPGPISCPGTLTHCLLDFWKIVFFKKRTEPPGKKTGSTEEGYIYILYTTLCPGKAAEKRKLEKAAAKAKNMPAAPKKPKVKVEVPPAVPAAAEADAEWPEDWDDEEWAEDGEDGEFPEDEHMEETGWTETISTWYVEIKPFNFVPVLCGILGFGRACTWSVGMCVQNLQHTWGDGSNKNDRTQRDPEFEMIAIDWFK